MRKKKIHHAVQSLILFLVKGSQAEKSQYCRGHNIDLSGICAHNTLFLNMLNLFSISLCWPSSNKTSCHILIMSVIPLTPRALVSVWTLSYLSSEKFNWTWLRNVMETLVLITSAEIPCPAQHLATLWAVILDANSERLGVRRAFVENLRAWQLE